MITELSKRNETYLVVLIEKNKSVNLNELVEKILKKQKEPFSKIYVVLMPMMIPAVLKHLNSKNIPIKGMSFDKTKAVLEV